MLSRLLIFLLIAVATVAALTSLGYPRTGNDSPSYAIIGQTILDGGMPYRDAWDVKGPGIYFINAICLFFFGKGVLAIRLFDIAWQLLTAWLGAAIAFRIYRRQSVRLIVFFSYLLYYYSQNFWSWLQSDSYASLPLAAGFLAMLIGIEKDRAAPWALAGACIGFATLLKLPLGATGIAMMLAACLAGGFALPRATRRLAALAAGFATPLVACGFYLYAGGALGDYLEAQLRYAPQYVQVTRDHITFDCLMDSLTRPVLLPLYAGILLAAFGLIIRWRCGSAGLPFTPNPPRADEAPALPESQGSSGVRPSIAEVSLMIWAALVYLFVWVQSVFFLYHYLPMVIPVAALAAGTLVPLYGDRRTRSIIWRFALPLFLLMMCVVPAKKIGEHTLESLRTLRSGYEKDIWLDAAQYVKERTAPHDRLYVWGSAASIYLHAERQPASRFLAVYPLSSYLSGLTYRDTLLREVRASRPAYVLVVKSVKRNFDCTYPTDEDAFLISFPALKDWIATEYTLELDQHQPPRYLLYRRK